MFDYRESAILRMLVLEKLSANRLAGRDAHRMEIAGRSFYSAAPQLPHRTGEESASVYGGGLNSGKTGGAKPPASFAEPWSEPSPERHFQPVLHVNNGKCEPTQPQSERLPPLGVGSHLTLIWSR